MNLPDKQRPSGALTWALLAMAAALVIGILLITSGCAAMTPEMQKMINQHTKAVDYYIDGTLPLKPEYEKLAKAIKETNSTLEDFANGK